MDDDQPVPGSGGLPAVPSPRLDDPEDVAWALSTAEAMWSRGEHADAIRWIRKGAASASEADNDGRAVELAKAAAELATMLRQESAPNVDAHAEALLEREVSAELRDVRSAIPHVPAPAAAPPAARIIGTAEGSKASKAAGASTGTPPGPPPRTLKVTSSSSTLNAVTPPKASAGGPVAPSAPKTPSKPPPPMMTASSPTPSSPPPKSEAMPPTARAQEPTPHHDSPTRPRGRMLTPTDIVHVPQRRPNPDATHELNVARELRAMVKDMAEAEEPPPPVKPSRPPPPPAGDVGVRPSQAVHVIVWRDARGVHVAPAGTVVSSITVDAMLVALDPNADLSAWLEARKPR
ncbi:MAG: hypothetical protein U0174_20935 [Polyangiaceae bacterium]